MIGVIGGIALLLVVLLVGIVIGEVNVDDD
jgi:hypothetical protein